MCAPWPGCRNSFSHFGLKKKTAHVCMPFNHRLFSIGVRCNLHPLCDWNRFPFFHVRIVSGCNISCQAVCKVSLRICNLSPPTMAAPSTPAVDAENSALAADIARLKSENAHLMHRMLGRVRSLHIEENLMLRRACGVPENPGTAGVHIEGFLPGTAGVVIVPGTPGVPPPGLPPHIDSPAHTLHCSPARSRSPHRSRQMM